MPLTKHVIHIDDSATDSYIYYNHIKKIKSDIEYMWFRNSHTLLSYLDKIYNEYDVFSVTQSIIILLDIHMPGENGFDVLKKLRAYAKAKYCLPPVIMLSSSNLECDKLKSHELGAADYHVKHIDPCKIRSNLEKLFDKWIDNTPTHNQLKYLSPITANS